MYLSYEEYAEMGGKIPAEAYPRYERKARQQIDRATHCRIRDENPVRENVKGCVYELIAAEQQREEASALSNGGALASASNDGVSVTFASSGTDATERSAQARATAIICTWLDGECTGDGVNLLYAGVDA